jgi:hypothetical protein
MIQSIIFFIIIFALYVLGINFFSQLNGRGKLQLLKVVFYAIILSVLTISTLAVFVILF